jgi:hypothetical protein
VQILGTRRVLVEAASTRGPIQSNRFDGEIITPSANSGAVNEMTGAVTEASSRSSHLRENDFPPRARVVASIIGPVAWLSFTLLYVGFWAHGFTLFQSVIVILVSVIILAGLMGALWASWGMRQRSWSWDR